MIVELRTYRTRPGMRDKFLELFREYSIPEHQRLGMPILGPFLCIENPDAFFFMRSFANCETREKLKAGFYEGPLWKEHLEGELMQMLEHYEFVVLDDRESRFAGKFG
jgi:hypothetical protein